MVKNLCPLHWVFKKLIFFLKPLLISLVSEQSVEKLSVSVQVVIFRLRTGHNRLNHHLYTKFRIGQTEQCPFRTGSQTTEHLLQSCPLHEALRKRKLPDHKAMTQKLYGCLADLQQTVAFTVETGLSIWRTQRRRRRRVRMYKGWGVSDVPLPVKSRSKCKIVDFRFFS